MRLKKHFKLENKYSKHSRIIRHASKVVDLDNIPLTLMGKIESENFTCYSEKFNHVSKYFLIEIKDDDERIISQIEKL